MVGNERYELGRFKARGQYCVYIYAEDRPRRRFSLSVPLDRSESEAWEAMQEYIRARKAALIKERGYRIGDLAELYLEDRLKEGKKDYVKVRRYIWDRNLKSTFGDISPESLV